MVIYHTNLNNKRLSKLQGTILEVLAEQSSEGVPRVEVARQVAKRYGNGSIRDSDQWLKDAYERIGKAAEEHKQWSNPEDAKRATELLCLLWEYKSQRLRQREWLTNKFSVSWQRSLKNLWREGLVEYCYPYAIIGDDTIGIRITAKGSGLLASRGAS